MHDSDGVPLCCVVAYVILCVYVYLLRLCYIYLPLLVSMVCVCVCVCVCVSQDRVAEQQKYGILYSDDYDYLQHLREPGSSLMEPGPTLKEPDSVLREPGPTLKEPDPTLKEPGSVRSQQRGEGPPSLPAELFGSELVVLGKLEKVLPVTGTYLYIRMCVCVCVRRQIAYIKDFDFLLVIHNSVQC